MKNRQYLFIVASALAVCCSERKAEQFKALPFPDVRVPSMMSESAQIAGYLAMNYWNGITDTSRHFPCDSALVSGVRKDEVEQKFADWTMLLDAVGIQEGRKAVARLYDRAVACERKDTSSNVFETFVELSQKYFYDPNSPMRNEDLYLPFVSRLASYEGLDPLMRGKYERETRLCSMNCVGSRAADFRFSDKSGRIGTLYGVDAEYTLLFFSNPGCEACKNIIDMLGNSPVIASQVRDGVLAVVNIYIDEDIQAWLSYMPAYPADWHNGFDPALVIRGDGIYDVRAIPSLYLLDKEKRVLMKDAPEQKVISFLENLAD